MSAPSTAVDTSPLGGPTVAQWTPTTDDGLDLEEGTNPAHRVYATLDRFGTVVLFSAAPFSAGVQFASGRVDALADVAVELEIDGSSGRAHLLVDGVRVIDADPFVFGGAQQNSLGNDFVLSAAYGPEFVGAAIIGESRMVSGPDPPNRI